MPVRLTDTKLKTLYSTLERQRQTNPGVTIGDEQVLTLLAAAADRSNASYTKVLSELKAPGLTRQAQVDLIKRGMTAGEKKDLEAILDNSTVPLAPSAKEFLQAAVGRGSGTVTGGPLTITGNQLNGLSGNARAGDKIEAINISAAPAGRLHMDDTMVIATANSSGKFANAKLTGDQLIREGDLIRLRARHADGSADEWVTVKASGLAVRDDRNAVVALFRIGLTSVDNGKVSVTNINESRQVSEPGAKLQFTNGRTGEKTLVTINDEGGFPAGFRLNGTGGDVFSIAATDGNNNTDFIKAVGKLTVPGAINTGDLVADPALHEDELNADGTPRFGKKRFTGPLFKDGVGFTDPKQGQIGNCYFPSAMASIAFTNPEAIKKMIKENGDGTYTVTFKEYDWSTSKFKDVKIKIDGDLYARAWGGPLYGASNGGDVGETTMELWYPLIEKAYAQWRGSYDAIGNGGSAGTVMQAVLGRHDDMLSISGNTADTVWLNVQRAVDNKQPISAGTYGESQAARYTNTGVYADHSYSVIGYVERNGTKYVKLRNPWGESEPANNGANDGLFELPLKDFMKLYDDLHFTIAGRT